MAFVEQITDRNPTHPVYPLFIERWSPRAFLPTTLPHSDLLTMLEAARWAPSAYNIQPWRFLYSIRGDQHWSTFLSLLDPFNASWAKNGSALVFVISDSVITTPETGEQRQSNYHHFDTGAAWTHLALQATALGYQAHAMAGIDFAQTREKLNIPERFSVEIAVAVGTPTSAETLPEALRKREQPSSRLPLSEIAFSGAFPQ